MEREKTNCERCGVPCGIVPKGTSRKTNQPYHSFYKCTGCGFNKSFNDNPEVKPKKKAAMSGQPNYQEQAEDPQLSKIIEGLKEVCKEIQGLRGDIKKVVTEEPDLGL